jgi:hypothetical protein
MSLRCILYVYVYCTDPTSSTIITNVSMYVDQPIHTALHPTWLETYIMLFLFEENLEYLEGED